MIKTSPPYKTIVRLAIGLVASVTAGQAAADIYPMQLLDYQIKEGSRGNIQSDPRAILGNNNQLISLGNNGWLAVKMEKKVYDGKGVDLTITVDAGGQQEEYEVFVSDSLKQWTSVGHFHVDAEIDFSAFNINNIQYVYIQDLHSAGIAPTQTPGADFVRITGHHESR